MIAHDTSQRWRQGERVEGGRREPFSGPQADQAEDAVGPHPLEHLFRDLAALQGYFTHYLAARSDAVVSAARRAVAWTALGLLAALAGVGLIITASVLLLNGIADGLTVLFGGRVWAGELTTGFLVLALVASGAYFGVRFWLNSSTRKIKEKYERRRSEERDAFGRDVFQRTAERASAPR